MPQVGFRVADLTHDLLKAVTDLYVSTVGTPDRPRELTGTEVSDAQELLEKGQGVEWRFGSRLTSHSKLKVTVYRSRGQDPLCYFYCHPNTNDDRAAVPINMANQFAAAADRLLRDRGVAIEKPLYG